MRAGPFARYDARMTSALALALHLVVASGPAFVEDDFPAALAKAKQEKKLLFVDAWAPWCHSCIFLRQHVLTLDALKPLEKDVVFAALDTEKAGAATFLAKYPVESWPTLFFIDPASGDATVRWVGTLDVTQFKALVASARKGGTAAAASVEGLLAKGATDDAAKALPTGKDVEATTVLRVVAALGMEHKNEACARTADEADAKLRTVVDRTALVGWGLGCVLELDAAKPEFAKLRASLLARAKTLVTQEGALADDVSGVYELLAQERADAKDEAAATKLALDWLAYLEAQAKRATTPAARAVFDPHRVNAALAAKVPARALPALEQSEKDFPADYNPPARQALLYRALKQPAPALAAIDRALAKCTEGPRKLRLFSTKEQLLADAQDTAGRRATLEAAIAWAKALPPSQRPPKRLEALEDQLAKLPKTPAR